MNIIHMRYALVVAETKSINKASERLYVGAPALSRGIKELEADLGVSLFVRSAKGMFLTPDGELFVKYAEKALKQIDDIENIFKEGSTMKERFSISVPRASYVATAFARFSKRITHNKDIELFYNETNDYRVVNNILKDEYRLGILRYSNQYASYYNNMMKEKGIIGELITEFKYVLVISEDSPLSHKDVIKYDDLKGFTEIAHADPYVPSLSFSEVKKDELPEREGNRIFVYERGSQFELLSSNPNTYMWVSPIPKELLERYNLKERVCIDNNRVYEDILIYKKEYKLTHLDNMFIEELVKAKREVFR